MATLVKDTHELINFLQSKGYTKEQAEGFVDAVKDFDLEKLATKEQTQLLTSKVNILIALNSAIFAGMIILLLDQLLS